MYHARVLAKLVAHSFGYQHKNPKFTNSTPILHPSQSFAVLTIHNKLIIQTHHEDREYTFTGIGCLLARCQGASSPRK